MNTIELRPEDEQAFNAMLNVAQTIGTQILTTKLYEKMGDTERADYYRKNNENLLNHLDRLIDLYKTKLEYEKNAATASN